MDLLKKTKDICQAQNIKPARSKGQNFLIREEIYNEIVKAADLNKDDIVLEVGPGLGFLTEKLAKSVKKLITVELDDKLAGLLEKRFAKEMINNVEIVNANILDFSIKYQELSIKKANEYKKNIPDTLYLIPNTKYKIVANLPYNITSVFLRKFLTSDNKPKSMVLMLQKEVAERITAKPGEMSMLAISVQYYAEAKIIGYVPKEDFWPQPEVDSAIIKIDINSKMVLPVEKEKDFFRLVKFGFSAKRKMLKNNLSGGLHISTEEVEKKLKLVNIKPTTRAQELGLDDWYKIFEVFG